MYDDDLDALAAEYVLGTLSAGERDHAQALISLDAGFEAAVRRWERRLGELNVMVEAIEPRPELWHGIKREVAGAQLSGAAALPPVGLVPPILPTPPMPQAPATAQGPPPMPQASSTPPQPPPMPQAAPMPQVTPLPHVPEPTEAAEQVSPVAALASSLLSDDTVEVEPAAAEPHADQPSKPPPVEPRRPPSVERSADVIYLARRMRRWRRMSFLFGAVAALLAVYVALWQVVPDQIPPQLWPPAIGGFARNLPAPSSQPSRLQQDRLVAVLQQDPTVPAFLLTFDMQSHVLVARRVSAKQETGRSYELWLISDRFPAPRSLGIVGADEFTQRPVAANFDVDTLRTAKLAISLEPAGGSPTGAPSGPVLFTGKAVDSLPKT